MNINTLLKDLEQISSNVDLYEDGFKAVFSTNDDGRHNNDDSDKVCNICGRTVKHNHAFYYPRLVNNVKVDCYCCPACKINRERLSEYRVHHPQFFNVQYGEFVKAFNEEVAWISDINHEDITTYMDLTNRSINGKWLDHSSFNENIAVYYIKPEYDYNTTWTRFIRTLSTRSIEVSNEKNIFVNIEQVPVRGDCYGIPNDIRSPDGKIIARGYARCVKISISHQDLVTRYPEEPYMYFEKAVMQHLYKPTVGTMYAFVVLVGVNAVPGNNISIQKIDLSDDL